MAITDKQIHKMLRMTSCGCPNCGSLLTVSVGWEMLSPRLRMVVEKSIWDGSLGIISLEEAIQQLIEHRDRGNLNSRSVERALERLEARQ